MLRHALCRVCGKSSRGFSITWEALDLDSRCQDVGHLSTDRSLVTFGEGLTRNMNLATVRVHFIANIYNYRYLSLLLLFFVCLHRPGYGFARLRWPTWHFELVILVHLNTVGQHWKWCYCSWQKHAQAESIACCLAGVQFVRH